MDIQFDDLEITCFVGDGYPMWVTIHKRGNEITIDHRRLGDLIAGLERIRHACREQLKGERKTEVD